jgi:hypothetical protein
VGDLKCILGEEATHLRSPFCAALQCANLDYREYVSRLIYVLEVGPQRSSAMSFKTSENAHRHFNHAGSLDQSLRQDLPGSEMNLAAILRNR